MKKNDRRGDRMRRCAESHETAGPLAVQAHHLACAVCVRGGCTTPPASAGVKVPAINKHLRNIFASGELARGATVSKMEMVRGEGGRAVQRAISSLSRR